MLACLWRSGAFRRLPGAAGGRVPDYAEELVLREARLNWDEAGRFSPTQLRDIDLTRADLRQADLSTALLVRANLRYRQVIRSNSIHITPERAGKEYVTTVGEDTPRLCHSWRAKRYSGTYLSNRALARL